jgi:hypothetical protein
MASSAPAFTFNGVKTVLDQYTVERDDIARAMYLHRESLRQFVSTSMYTYINLFNAVHDHGERLTRTMMDNRTAVLCTLISHDSLSADYKLRPEDVTNDGLTDLLVSDDLKAKFVVWIGNQPAEFRTAFTQRAKDLNSKSETLVADLIASGVQLYNSQQRENDEVVSQLCTDHHVAQQVDQSPPVANAGSQPTSDLNSYTPPTTADHTTSVPMGERPRVTINTSKCGSCCSSKKKRIPSPKQTGWFNLW